MSFQHVKEETKTANFFRKAGFGVGMGYWSKKSKEKLVGALSQLTRNPKQAIYFGGLLGFLSFRTKLPQKNILARLRRYFLTQYTLLDKQYFFFVFFFKEKYFFLQCNKQKQRKSRQIVINTKKKCLIR